MSNSFGRAFRITTFGESHGGAVGVTIDGCPARLELDREEVQRDLARRRPGQSALVSPRNEPDVVRVVSGLEGTQTLGTPITMYVENRDARPADYGAFAGAMRPSHADFTTDAKFGIRARTGGGRASARETLARVAAGAVARQLLRQCLGIEIVAWVDQIGDVRAPYPKVVPSRAEIDKHPTRCFDAVAAGRMQELIESMQASGDSIGGAVQAVASGVPPGLGEPTFDKLEACLAHAMLSLPACRGFEVGSGFAAAGMQGSRHNDAFVSRTEARPVGFASNNSGGIQGGISNGADICVRAAFKPPATLGKPQMGLDAAGATVPLGAGKRHDPCVVPRAAPIVEAMMALVLIDHALLQHVIARRL